MRFELRIVLLAIPLCSSFLVFFSALYLSRVMAQESTIDYENKTVESCEWIHNRKCPDPLVRFYLFTRSNINESQLIYVDDAWETSNLSQSLFNPQHPSKIIVHGFRSGMFLKPLYDMKFEYLAESDANVFFVDWHNLSTSPFICYPFVVHNIRHVGECAGQLIRRIRDTGSDDIHIIGFSLGAQVINYITESLKPEFKVPRISGIDPAWPGFITVDKAHKLDASDALYVDVYHCNSLFQGDIRRCGHVDFYFNNAITQPGCNQNRCSHHRCAEYFFESIRSPVGFYGQKCKSYFHFILGLCQTEAATLAGEHCDTQVTHGIFHIRTNSNFPYARGQERNEMRSSSIDENEFEMIRKKLETFCNSLISSEDHDDIQLYQFLNCKRYGKNVLMKAN